MRVITLILLILLAGCSGGAVVFAPTPAPPDLSPMRYDHPSGAFSVAVPRHWPVFTQHTTTLASATFSPPDVQMRLTFAVLQLADDATAFGDLIDRYQMNVRTDGGRYKEENREAMGDGSWRLSGLRLVPGGTTQQVNTFIERSGQSLGIIETVIPDDPALLAELQNVINTFEMNPDATLEPADLSVFAAMAANSLDVLNVSTWRTPAGVFFVTGEVANYGTQPVVDLPVRAVLYTEDGLPVAEAVDVPMGYAVLPGGFAPFSLRFGQGQPALTTNYALVLGAEDWMPDPEIDIIGPDDLSWIDESTFNDEGALVINGTMTNIGTQRLRDPRVSVTIFNERQAVIAAAFNDMPDTILRPNESAEFQVIVPELGGNPAQYIVNIQALPG